MELIPKRGFLPYEKDNKGVANMIQSRGWETFMQQPEEVVEVIVWEFYANTLEAEGNIVQVKGKFLLYTKTVINAYLYIHDMEEEDEFMNYRANRFH